MQARAANPAEVVELDGPDLPAYCPNARMPIWSGHPKVYIDLTHDREGRCPYCGTLYRLKPGAIVKGTH